MAVTAKRYLQAVLGQYSGTAARRVDWAADTVKVMLLKEAYTPLQDTDDFVTDVSAQEISGTGYTAGGATLASKTATSDGPSNTVRLGAADTEWPGASFSAYYAVIYKDTGVAATSPLQAYADFGENKTVSSSVFKIEWAADGAMRVVVD